MTPARPRPAGRGGRSGRPGSAPRGRSRSGASARSRREGLGGEQVEGRRAVRELLAAGRRRVRDVWVSETADPDHPLVAEILDLAREARVPVRHVGRGRLDAEARSEAPQGVLAHAEPLAEALLERLARPDRQAAGEVPAFLVVVDGVTDPQNLGALLRVADGAGATGLVLPRHRAVHVTPTVAKAAAGAIEYVPVALVAGVPAALRSLGAAGVWTVGLEAEATQTVFELGLATQPVALVLGAEGSGLSRLTRQRCDVLASIPRLGALDSLNVATAGAVACYEVARRRLA